MNEKTNNQQQGIEKMFTQSDVNRIIGERLSRDKFKGNEDLEKRESELMARELKFIAKQLLTEKGLPAEIADILKLESEASVTEAVELLSKLFGSSQKKSDLKVVNERKLPTGKNDDESYGQLRRAFGLI